MVSSSAVTSPRFEERRRPHGGAPIGLGILGCGTVGGGVLRLLTNKAAEFERRVGVPLEVRRVLVRDLDKPRVPELDRAKLTTRVDDVLEDESVEIVVEVMGGEDLAGAWVERALDSRRSVVTANKAMLAKRGPQLLDLAAAKNVGLAFEAAVGGGIPVVRTLRDAFASDEVIEIAGILNGTSNYILTRMTDDGAPFAEVLAEAQSKGYAEADPSLDIDGHDAAQKLLVLAMLAFGARPPDSGMLIEGIRGLDAIDVRLAGQFGYVIKHLAFGRDRGETVELRAHPVLVKRSSVLANINGVLNAIRLEGRALGPCLLSGRGAGDMPTAVSVVADVLDAARAIVAGAPGIVNGARPLVARPLTPTTEIALRYYLRLSVADEPGVMAEIAGALGREGVSLSQIVQTEGAGGVAQIVIITHVARESAVKNALVGLEGKRFLRAPAVLLRIEEG
ncbi:MAG: homoserine dehydrogenase [Polyangiaceae bacterium]|nr:homoserine dehydrogenase [Polyangiaceae bacterium]MBK8938475.1 homoserine dehydrogenase [Polyangiaceae bacterium]